MICDNCKNDFPEAEAIIIPIERKTRTCCGYCGEWLQELVKIHEKEVLVGRYYDKREEI